MLGKGLLRFLLTTRGVLGGQIVVTPPVVGMVSLVVLGATVNLLLTTATTMVPVGSRLRNIALALHNKT